MHGAGHWVFLSLVIAWLTTPWVLVAWAWKKWVRVRAGFIENFIDDPALLLGQIFATVSCCGLVPFYLPVAPRWEQTRVDAIGWGLIITAVSVLIALFILPFGLNRIKWLSLSSCLLNLGALLLFALAIGE